MGKYLGVFLAVMFICAILFFVLGSIGWLDYIDGVVMTFGLIIALQNSVIISLLVYIIDLTRSR